LKGVTFLRKGAFCAFYILRDHIAHVFCDNPPPPCWWPEDITISICTLLLDSAHVEIEFSLRM